MHLFRFRFKFKSLLLLPPLLSPVHAPGHDDLHPGQKPDPLPEGAVGEDGMVASGQQDQVLTNVLGNQPVLFILPAKYKVKFLKLKILPFL